MKPRHIVCALSGLLEDGRDKPKSRSSIFVMLEWFHEGIQFTGLQIFQFPSKSEHFWWKFSSL